MIGELKKLKMKIESMKGNTVTLRIFVSDPKTKKILKNFIEGHDKQMLQLKLLLLYNEIGQCRGMQVFHSLLSIFDDAYFNEIMNPRPKEYIYAPKVRLSKQFFERLKECKLACKSVKKAPLILLVYYDYYKHERPEFVALFKRLFNELDNFA